MADSVGADIITTSLGYSTFEDPSMDYSSEDLDGKTSVISRATTLAFSRGMITVTSAGNSGNKPWQYVTMPSDVDVNISVGAVDENRTRAVFSSVGPTADGRIKPDVMAMGAGAIAVSSTAGLRNYWGTSISAPQIAGFAAGLWQAYPWLNNGKLLELIRNSGDNSNQPNYFQGYGIPSYLRASRLAESESSDPYLLYPNPSDKEIRISSIQPRERVRMRMFTRTGKLIRESDLNFENAGSTTVINIEELRAGLYVVQLISSNEVHSYNIVRQ